MDKNLDAGPVIDERIRQFAEIAFTVAKYEDAASSVALTGSETRATVSAGSEVEPQTHLTTQYEQ
jgi:hypothetical protein